MLLLPKSDTAKPPANEQQFPINAALSDPHTKNVTIPVDQPGTPTEYYLEVGLATPASQQRHRIVIKTAKPIEVTIDPVDPTPAEEEINLVIEIAEGVGPFGYIIIWGDDSDPTS